MTNEPRWHPDLLRRFVATPYIFKETHGATQICVESNDLEIALSVRHSSAVQQAGTQSGRLLCRLIRDGAAPVEGSESLLVSHGVLRTLHFGRGTILIHDREKSELLGFISPNVKAHDLISSLIPALFSI